MSGHANPRLTIHGNRFKLDGQPFEMWGIRTASASQSEQLTEQLIAQLDEYRAHGVNTVTVFYMGSRGGASDPFSPEGREIDAAHQLRMERIIQAAGKRGMVVVAGIFYQWAPFGLQDARAVRAAVRTVTETLRPYNNIIINIANEQNAPPWDTVREVFNFRDPQGIIHLAEVVHATDPQRLVGGGGFDHDKNIILGLSPALDALLFDTTGSKELELDSGTLYKRFVDAGITNKPIVNVELFGGWTKRFPGGVFPDEAKQIYYRDADAAAAHPGLSVFFHSNPWLQNQKGPIRFDLGGQGTAADPGIRWYFEYVKKIVGQSGSKSGHP